MRKEHHNVTHSKLERKEKCQKRFVLYAMDRVSAQDVMEVGVAFPTSVKLAMEKKLVQDVMVRA